MHRPPLAFLLAALVLPGCRDAGGGAETEAGEDTSEVLRDVPQAADIGFDEGRRRVLVPTFADELHLVPLPEGG